MLNVTVKTTDADLTTTGALKARLFGTTSTSTGNDAYLSAVIRAASRWAEGYVGYPLTVQSYEETVPSYGRRTMMLRRTPLRSVRVFESTETDAYEVTSTQFWVEDAEAGLLSRDEGWPWTVPTELELEERPLPGEESQPWYTQYTAGYSYNGLSTDSSNWSTAGPLGSTSTGERTLPEDVEEAVLMKARSIWEHSFEGGEVESERLGDLAVTYRGGSEGRAGAAAEAGLGAAELLLARFRRVV